MKYNVCLFLSLALFSSLSALPENGDVAAGQVDFAQTKHSLKITASDKSIINYSKFHIGKGEKVQFIQPSSKATVLNRVTGKDSSKILGELSANGRVFLVNPYGVYFGPDAVVNTGSFIASTLNIRDEDFLNGAYQFFLEEGSENAKIVNEGVISAAEGGFIGLFSPIIENRGSILARAEKIFLASAEKVTLDFTGDGLIQFAVEGDLKEALIENLGTISAPMGDVALSLRAAKSAIKTVVNTDGAVPAVEIIEQPNGTIRLASSIEAQNIYVDAGDGSLLSVEGRLDVPGGAIHLLGDHIFVKSARVDASGDLGGGTILIGGDYQGGGSVRNAQMVWIDPLSQIYSDARQAGDGGKVIVWADDTALFDGQIFARGGPEGGNGGFVETSGKINLGITLGNVNALAPKGRVGDWLMDPTNITIASGGGCTLATAAVCGGGACSISAATINAAAANVLLCANGNITQNASEAINIAMAGVGITFRVGSGTGTTTLNNTVQTNGGAIVFDTTATANNVVINANLSIISGGAAISFSNNLNSSAAARTLTVTAGAGSITVTGITGATNAFSSLTMSGTNITMANLGAAAAGVTGATSLTATGSINFTGTNYRANAQTYTAASNFNMNAGAATTFFSSNDNIAFNTGTIVLSAGTNLTVNNVGGTAASSITLGAVRSPSALQTLTLTGVNGDVQVGDTGIALGEFSTVTMTGANIRIRGNIFTNTIAMTAGAASTIFLGGGITTNGTDISFNRPVTRDNTASVTVTTGGVAAGNVTFTNTIAGDVAGRNLTVNAGTGGAATALFNNTIGTGAIPLGTFTVTAGNLINFDNTVDTNNGISLTAPTVNVPGNITNVTAGTISISGNVLRDTNNACTISNSGGGNISITGTVNGDAAATRSLTLTGNTGSVTVGGAIGATNSLNTLTVTGANITLANIGTAGADGVSGTTTLTATSAVNFTGTNYRANTQSYTAGTFFNMNAGALTTFTSSADAISFTTGTIQLANNSDLTINSANGVITTGNIRGNSLENLTINAGVANVTVGSIGIALGEFNATSITGANLNLNGDIYTDSITLTPGVASTIFLGGGIATNGTNITFSRPVTRNTSNTSVVTTSTATGNVTFQNTINGDVAGRNLTVTAGTGATGTATFNNTIGATVRLATLTVSAGNLIDFDNTVSTTTGISLTAPTIQVPNNIDNNTSGNIVFTGNTIRDTNANATISNAGGGNIQFTGINGRINGDIAGRNLTINANTGNVIFDGAIGNTQPLNVLSVTGNTITQNSTVNNASNVTYTGAINVNGNITTSGGVISMVGAVTASTTPTFDSTNGGGTPAGANISFSSTLNGATAITFRAGTGGNVSFTGAVGGTSPPTNLTFTSASLIQVGSNITVSGANPLIFSSPVSLTGTSNITSNNANITFSSTLNGAQALTLTAGTGTITFTGAVGGTTPLTNLIFASGALTQIGNNITVSGANPLVFSTPVFLTGTSIILSNNANITLSSTLNGAQNLTLNAGTGIITLGTIGNTTPLTSLTLIASAVQFGGNITTNGTPLSFSLPVTLIANIVLDTTNSGAVPAGANISFTNTVDGARNLGLTAGTGGAVSFGGAVGGTTRIGALSVNSAASFTTAAVTAGSISQTTGDSITFNGALNTNTISGIVLTGSTMNFNGTVTATTAAPVTLTNSGTLTIASGANFSVGSTFTQNGAGSNSLSANITTSAGGISFLQPITLGAASILNSSAGPGTISLSSTVNGTQSLTLTAGTSTATVSGAVGASTPLSSLSITADTITLANIGAAGAGVTGSTTATALTTMSFTGTTYNGNAQSYTASVNFNMNAGALTTFSSNGQSLSFNTGTIQLSAGTDFTLSSSGGAISTAAIHAPTNNLRTLIVNAGANTVQVGTIGAVGNNEFTSAALTGTNITLGGNTIANTITLTPTGTIFIGGNVASENTALLFSQPVVLQASPTISSGSTGANITFSSTVNGDADDIRSLSLAAGTGSIMLSGAVGNTGRLSGLTFATANNVTAGAISADSLFQLAGTGTTTFNGAIFVPSAVGVFLIGNNFTVNNTVTTLSTGPMIVTNAGTLDFAGTASLSGAFTQNGAGTTTLSGSITAGQPISFATTVNLSGTPSLSTAAANQDIIFSGTVEGPGGLTLAAGTGNISLNQNAGAVTRIGAFVISSAQNISVLDLTTQSISLINGTGTITQTGSSNTNGAAGITLSGNNFISTGNFTVTGGGSFSITNTGTVLGSTGGSAAIDGSFTQLGTGPFFLAGTITTMTGGISFQAPITLGNPSTLNSSAGGGTITLSNTVDGNFNLTLSAGAGNIIFSSTVGGTTPINNLLISTAAGVSTQAVSAATISSTGTGAATFNGDLTTTGAAGITISAGAVTRGANITTSNNGPLTITNSGTFTSTAAGTISLDGAFTQNGAGSVSLGQTIVTTNDGISFASPITLGAATVLNTGPGAGDITLSQTVQGGFSLTLNSGTGDISLMGNIGTTTRLNVFTITTANHLTAQSIFASSISHVSSTGIATFNGPLNTNGAAGISITGNVVNFNQTITTTNAGPFSLVNSGSATFAAAATGSIAGSFTQLGIGTSQLSNAITAGGVISFNGAVTISGTSTLNSSNNAISFLMDLDGPGDLSLTAGSGSITFSDSAGAMTALGGLSVISANNWTTQDITATSITQSSGTGTTLFNNNISTSGASGISLTGAAFTFLGNATASGTGPVTIANSSTLTTTAGKTISSGSTFSQTGGGSVSLAGNVTTNNANLSFTNAITLTAPVSLNSGAGAGDITLAATATVNGNQPMTLNSGTGDINLNSAIGAVTRIGALTITLTNNASVQDITAASITQSNGTGTTSLLGDLNTNGPSGIAVTGNNFISGVSVTTTNSGPLIITNSGTATALASNNVNLDGPFTQNGTGPVVAGGTVVTHNQNISFASAVTLGADASFDTGAGAGNITFSQTVDGNKNLTLAAGIGDIFLNMAVGGMPAIGTLTISSAQDVTATDISASSISGSNLTGISTFNGSVSTSAIGGISLSGLQFVFNNNVTTAGGGPCGITNSGSLTIAPGSVFSIAGAFTQTGAGTVSLGSSITTSNATLSIASPITLTAMSSLSSGAGAGSITLSQAINGAFPLSLTGGTGNVNLQGAVGNSTPPTSLVIVSATDVMASSAITVAGPLTLMSSSGTATFSGAVSTTTASGINLTGTNFLFSSPVTTTGGGPIAISNAGTLTIPFGSNFTSSSTFAQTNAGGVFIGADVTTTGTLQIASALSLTHTCDFDSGGSNMTLAGTVNGAVHFGLTAGAGDITLSSAIGGTTPPSSLTISSAKNVTATAISAGYIEQTAGTMLSHFTGALSTTAMEGISLTGSQFTFDQGITTMGSGPLAIVHTGTLDFTAPAAAANLSGAFTESGGGGVSTQANITTSNQNIQFADAITLTGDVILNSGAGAGNINLSNTVDGGYCLTLQAGTGTITLSGALGSGTPLNCLSATGQTINQNSSVQTMLTVQETGILQISGNITTANNNITLTGDVTLAAASVTLNSGAGTGDVHITGTVNGNIAGRNLTITAGTGDVLLDSPIGNMTTFNNLTVSANNISWNNLGSGVFGATGTVSLTAAADIDFNGTSYRNGTQNYTAGSNFNFNAGALTTIQSNVLPITFMTGTIQLSADNDLTVQSFGGNITIADMAVVPTSMHPNLILDASTGDVTAGTVGSLANKLYDVTFTGTTVTYTMVFASNSFTVNSVTATLIGASQLTPGASQTYNGPVVLTADNITFSTCNGMGMGASITFNSTLDADMAANSRNIVIETCNNPVVFNGPVGSIEPLDSITIGQANDVSNVTANSTFITGAFSQASGTGTTAFNSGITTTDPGGISISTHNITLQGAVSTTGGGPATLTIDATGTLTIQAGSSLDIDGAFQQNGVGSVSLGGTLMTHDATIQFAAPITLNGTAMIDSSSATGGNISFASTINGAQNLTIDSGTADITFSAPLGGMTRLGAFTINDAHDVTATTLTAASITQLAGTGTTSFNGALNTNTISGISLTGAAFTIDNTVTTTSGGGMSVTNSGLLTMTSNATCSLAGGFTESGTGSVSLSNSITAGGAISFGRPVSLAGSTTLNTSLNSQNITFSNTLDGPGALTMNLGGGDLFLLANAGSGTRLGALLIQSADDISAQGLRASSITQMAGTGITTISGSLDTNAIGGINLTGTNFNINSTITTTNSGPFVITNTGGMSLTGGMATSISGAFTQSGGGAVSLAGTIATVNQNLTFTNAISLTNTTNLSTGAGAGDIHIIGTMNGTQALNMAAGTGDIQLDSSIGSSTPLGAISISTANNLTAAAITAASLQHMGSGSVNFNGALLTSGGMGISVAAGAITRGAAITTTGGGPLTITNSGLFTSTAAGNISLTGDFTQNGAGSVTFGGNLLTQGNSISFASPITLAADAVFDADTGMGNINISQTIQGGSSLFLNTSAGDITLSGNIGTTNRLTSFTISNAHNVSAQTIFASSILEQNGTGTSTFNGPLNTNGASGIDLDGNIFNFNSTLTTTNSGPFALDNTGLATFAAAATGSFGGSFTQTGTGTTQLSNSITAGGAIFLTGPVTSSGTASLNSSGNNITFSDIVDGPGNINLTAGTGSISLQGDVGSMTAPGTLTITSANNVTTAAVTAGSIVQSAGTGTTLFNNSVSTSAAGGINLTGASFTFLDNATTTGTGPITINNSGTLTTTAGKTLSSDSTFSQLGGGSVSLAGNIATNNANLSFTNPITLTAAASLDSGAGAGNILLGASATINGNQSLTLNAGTGDVTLNAAIGGSTRIGDFQITLAHDISIQAITAASITQQNGTGTSTLLGSLNTNAPAGITLAGNNFISSGAVTTTNGGPFTLTNSGLATGTGPSSINLSGAFLQNGAGTVVAGGTLTTANADVLFTGPTFIGANFIINTGPGTGHVTFLNAVNGTQSLTILSGVGTVTFSQPIGTLMPFSALSVSGHTLTASDIGGGSAGVTGSTIFTSSHSIIFTGTTYNANSQAYQATTTNDITAGPLTTFTSSNDPITFGGDIELSAGVNLTISSNGGAITTDGIHAAMGDLRTLILNANTGNIEVGDIGLLANGEFASVDLTGNDIILGGHTIADTITFNPGGTFFITGDVVSTNTPLTFSRPIVLNGTPTISSGVMGANLSFFGTIDGDANDVRGFTVDAQTGDISFNGAIGNTGRLASLVINSGHDVSAQSIIADALFQISGTGTTTFNSSILIPSVVGIQLTGNNFIFSNTITTLSGGPMVVDNSGTLTLSSTANLSGAFTQIGMGGVNFSGSITAGQPVYFAGPINLSSNPSISTAAAAQDIIFDNTIDGSGNLTLASGTGNIFANQDMGSMTRIGTLTVTSAQNIAVQSVIATSLNLISGTGLVSASDNLDTNTAAGMNFVGNHFINNGTITVTGGGSFVINNSGTIIGTVPAATLVDGSFLQIGTGPVFFGGSVTASTGDISFTSMVTLGNPTTLDTSAGTGSITFNNMLDGNFPLSLSTSTGDILFQDNVGLSESLSAITITNAHDVTFSGTMITSSILQITGTGTTIINGPSTANPTFNNPLVSVQIVTNNIEIHNTLNTTGAGSVILTNSGLLTYDAVSNIDGSFTQNGTGSTLFSGSITAQGSISFMGPVVNSGTTSLVTDPPVTFMSAFSGSGSMTIDTTFGGGNITFMSTIDGPLSLTLIAGAGDISVVGAIGATTPLQDFIISSANDVSLSNIGGPGAGVTGTMSIIDSNDINLSGTTYSAGSQSYFSGVDTNLTAGAPVTFTTFGQLLTFPHGIVTLSAGTNFLAITNDGDFLLENIIGTLSEDVTIQAGSGAAHIRVIDNAGTINAVSVDAGSIDFGGIIDAQTADFVSLSAIFNFGAPFAINTAGIASFNALGGDVGTLTNPILVNTPSMVYAGSTYLADFNGSTGDNTIHEIPSNPPCVIIFNGVTIKDCGTPPVPPSPSAPAAVIPFVVFPAPGFDDSYFNLASDFYFLPYFLDDRYVKKDVAPMFYRPKASH